MDHSEVKHLPKVDHTPAELDEVSRLLLKAAAKIERDGWCQGDWGSYDRPTCMRGAIMFSTENMALSLEARRRMDLAVQVGGAVPSLQWNDAKGRTKDEVLAKLRAVALGL